MSSGIRGEEQRNYLVRFAGDADSLYIEINLEPPERTMGSQVVIQETGIKKQTTARSRSERAMMSPLETAPLRAWRRR